MVYWVFDALCYTRSTYGYRFSHESLLNVTPANLCCEWGNQLFERRKQIKDGTLKERRKNQIKAAITNY